MSIELLGHMTENEGLLFAAVFAAGVAMGSVLTWAYLAWSRGRHPRR